MQQNQISPIDTIKAKNQEAYKSAKDAVLFVIEVSPSMLTAPPPLDIKKPERDHPTSAALKCAYALMQQRIISNPNDMMGVLLYGTEQTKFQEEEQARGGLAYPHCYLLTDLDIPAAEDVKALRSLVEDEEESKNLLVSSKERVSMANVLFCANQIFTTKAPNFSSRRLFIVTDDDDPHANDKALKASAAVRAKDLYDLGVIIELFPISKPGHEFNRSKFYDVGTRIYSPYSNPLTSTGRHLQRSTHRPRSPSTDIRHHRPNNHQRRNLPPNLTPHLHKLQSRRPTRSLLLHAPRTRPRLQNQRERLHSPKTTTPPPKLLHLSLGGKTPHRHRHHHANRRRHGAQRGKSRNQKSLQVRWRKYHLQPRRGLLPAALRRPRHPHHRLQTAIHASHLGQYKTRHLHISLGGRLHRLHTRLLRLTAETPPRRKNGSCMVCRTQKRRSRHRRRSPGR